MNDEDRKYLAHTEKARPGLEVFSRMVQILASEQKKINELFAAVDNTLLKACEVS
jgi:hypothetical protein